MKLFVGLLLVHCVACNRTLDICDTEAENFIYPMIAHSHNDYEQEEPITNALNHGFRSLEVDIAFDGNLIKVSHDEKDLNNKDLFEEDYLIPFINEVQDDSSDYILLIDIKNYSLELLNELNRIVSLQKKHLITRSGSTEPPANIKIILSGEIPRQEIISQENYNFFFVDGRMFNDDQLSEVDLNSSSHLIPLISMDFENIVNWNGKREPSDKTFESIKNTVDRVHQKDKMIRFWNTSDREKLWLTLHELGVDIIGVDNIDHFCGVMKENGLDGN